MTSGLVDQLRSGSGIWQTANAPASMMLAVTNLSDVAEIASKLSSVTAVLFPLFYR
jgi:hypothetical protein